MSVPTVSAAGTVPPQPVLAIAPAAARARPLSAPHDGAVEVGGHLVGRGRTVVPLDLLDRTAARDQVGQAALVRLPADELLRRHRDVAAGEHPQQGYALPLFTPVGD